MNFKCRTDDFVQSKRRHLYIAYRIFGRRDGKDDFVQSKDDIHISHIEFLEDAESKDDFNR